MSTVDFTKIHPRTLLWFAQRETCRTCEHCHISPFYEGGRQKHSGGGWHCKAARIGCMYARDEGKPCGPDATLFQPKEQSE